MWPFGCRNHHYGEGRCEREVKVVKKGSYKYVVKQKVKKECLHDGCDKTKTDWDMELLEIGFGPGCSESIERFEECVKEEIFRRLHGD